MHPFSLNDEQVEQISGGYFQNGVNPYTGGPISPSDYTWGIGEEGTVEPWMNDIN